MPNFPSHSAIPAPIRPSAFKSRDFDDRVETLMREWKVPGLAIAIIDGEKTEVKNYGYANLETKRPVDDQTLFNCASTSKSFTSASLALIIEDEQKEVSDAGQARGFTSPVKDFLPEDFVLFDPYYTDNVTIEDILSHRSGMPRHDDSYLGIRARTVDSPRSVTQNLRNLPLTAPLRAEWQYCNMMYTVGVHLVQKLSSKPFAQFLSSRFWQPLEMTNTYLDIPGRVDFHTLKSQMATGYFWSKETVSFKPVAFWSEPEALGAGSIYSSVSDFAKWIRCMMTKAPPLSKQSHEELVKPRIICEPDQEIKHFLSHKLYALGWETQSYRGYPIVGHDGCVMGFNSTMNFLPGQDWGIVIFNNGDEGAGDLHQILMFELLDDLLQIPLSARLDWNQIHQDDFKEMKQKSEENDTKEDEPDDTEDDTKGSPRLPTKAYAGLYHNQGYHTIRLRLEGENLSSNCTDRSFGFHLDIVRRKTNHFTAKLRDDLGNDSVSVKVRFELGEGGCQVTRFGINLEDAMKDLVWFERVVDEDPQA